MANQRNINFSKKEDLQLLEDLDNYIKLVNENTKGTSLKRTDLVRNFIKELLAGKVLTNDFIFLEEPFYFNKSELMANSTVKATNIYPKHHFNEQMMLLKVPNNLDMWKSEFNSYCVEENIHEGIIHYIDIITDDKGNKKNKILLFNFILRTEKNSIKDITVNYIDLNELELFLGQYDDDLAEVLLNEFRDLYNDIKKDRLENGLSVRDCSIKYNDFDVLRMLSFNQISNDMGELSSKILNNIFDAVDILIKDANVIKEINEKEEISSEELNEIVEQAIEDKIYLYKSLLNPDLTSKEGRTLDKIYNILETVPENPFDNILNSSMEILEKANNSEEPVPIEKVEEDLFDILITEGFSLKDTTNFKSNSVEAYKLLEEKGVNPNVLKYFNVFINSESKEEYKEEINKLTKELFKFNL